MHLSGVASQYLDLVEALPGAIDDDKLLED
jgi:hypothetical protein